MVAATFNNNDYTELVTQSTIENTIDFLSEDDIELVVVHSGASRSTAIQCLQRNICIVDAILEAVEEVTF